MVVLFGNAISIMLAEGIYGNLPGFSQGSTMPTYLLAYPQLAFVRLIYLLNYSCAAKLHCYNTLALGWGNEVSRAVTALFLGGTTLLLLGLYLEQVLPRKYGLPQHPLFPLRWILRKGRGLCKAPPPGREPLRPAGLGSSDGWATAAGEVTLHGQVTLRSHVYRPFSFSAL